MRGNRTGLRASIRRTAVICAAVLAVLTAFTAGSSTATAAGAAVPVMVDTDMYSSVDDVGALAVTFALQQQGEAKVVAMGVDTRTSRPAVVPNSWKCTAAVAQFYNSGNVPIGVDGPANGTTTNDPDFVGPCAQKMAAGTPTPDSAVNVYRRALVAQPDGSVVFLSIGYLENLAALLRSPADSISPLTGAQLVAQKVKSLVLMGGGFPTRSSENNLTGDPTSAQYVVANWPTKMVWSGYEVGDAFLTGQNIPSTHPASSPVRIAYGAFIPPGNGYFSYDLSAAYAAIRPSDAAMTPVGPGNVTVTSSGGTSFSASASGKSYYLKLNDAAGLGSTISSLLAVQPTAPDTTPPVISNVNPGTPASDGTTVNWSTDEQSDTQVEYGPTTAYGSLSPVNTALTTSHSQALTGLNPGTLYHYRVKSKDASGNLAVSPDATFTTAAVTGPTLTAPATAAPGASVTVAWQGVVNPTVNDWIGMYAQGAVDTGFLFWKFTATCSNQTGTPRASGSCSFTMPSTNGTYEFRLFAANGYTKLANSGLVTVGSATTAPPVISAVAAGSVNSGSATISWTTDRASDSQIEYGQTTAYGGATSIDSAMLTSHAQMLSGLSPATVYHYRVKSRDASGSLAVSPDYTFTTAASSSGQADGSPTATPAAGTGPVTLTWSTPPGLNAASTSYTLQRKGASESGFTTLASGITSTSYTISWENQGVWTYRVIASDGTNTNTSPASSPVIVDRTPPSAPSFQADRAPEYTGDGDWWKGSVTLTTVPNGDPNLPDGSPGSGIDAASTTVPVTVSRSGPTIVDGWVKDVAGNWTKGSTTVQVDATPPEVWWNTKCGQTFKVRQVAYANWGSSDANVGIAGDYTGNVQFNTTKKGKNQSVSVTVADKVGNTTTISCGYEVR